MLNPSNFIPDFVNKLGYPFGLLPDGVYPCDEPTLLAYFVGAFPESQTRESVCNGFFRLRHAVAERGIAATQWIDGSFVESKPEPEDVDVVSFCDYDQLNSLDTQSQQFVVEYLGGREKTKGPFRTHGFLVPCCRVGHAYHPVFEKSRSYWRTWFGKTRDIPNPAGLDLPGHAKGFVEMRLGDPVVELAITTNRSQP